MATMKVKGMSCHHCVMAVTEALSNIRGVSNVNVDLVKGEATFDEMKPVDSSVVKKAIENAGYEIDE